MNSLKKLSHKDKKTYFITIALFLAICIVMGFLCFGYYAKLQDTVKAESGGYMEEISKQMATNASETIEDNFAVLRTIATVLINANMDSYQQLQATLKEQKEIWKYDTILLIDEEGVAYNQDGKKIAVGSETYLQSTIVDKKNSMSTSQIIDGKERIVFAIPLENITIENKNMAAMAMLYDLSTFDKILSMTAFNGSGYAHIIRQDGTVVIRSSSQYALQTGYNILNSLSKAEIVDEKRMEDIKSEIANGESGQVEFSIDNRNEYMTYTPLGTDAWCLLTFVPVDVVNEKSSILLSITLLLCSIITIAFSLLFGTLMFVNYRNKRKLEQIAYVDPITGGNTIQRFYELTQEVLSSSIKPQYALIYINIEKFKVLNEQFGRNVCDEILGCMENAICSDLEKDECIGRLFADNFCVLVKYTDENAMVARFTKWQSIYFSYLESRKVANIPMSVAFGVFVIDNSSIPIAHMIDRAKISLMEVAFQFHGKFKYAIYDETVRQLIFREKQLEDMMERALHNREFQVYLQPKYKTQTEEIGGAEALIRWVNPVEGMIYPDEFIPLFEKNGFVVKVDLFVFEEVCCTLRKWIDAGHMPIKISVNCSRIHLKDKLFLKKYNAIAEKYQVPKKWIEIELTENTVFENVEHLSEIINRIHKIGFGCAMDDFGSGYSSLNLIKDIPVDTLKLDKVFFRSGIKDIQRTESVVGSIIAMSKALSLETVAEGVEERAQVDMLKRLSCDYIQGYYFARPMPISEFEQLAFAKKQDENGLEAKEDI